MRSGREHDQREATFRRQVLPMRSRPNIVNMYRHTTMPKEAASTSRTADTGHTINSPKTRSTHPISPVTGVVTIRLTIEVLHHVETRFHKESPD